MSSPRPKILIVDDLSANLTALRMLLKHVDAEVIAANSGNAALALCLEHEFALILLDIHMPDMDGYEVAELLHDDVKIRDTPIIFVTAAYKDIQHQIRGYGAGAVDYIEKPIDDTILLSKVRVFIELYNRRHEDLRAELAERKRVERALRASEEQLRLFIEQTPLAVAMLDRNLKFMLTSERWLHILCPVDMDVRGRIIESILPDIPKDWPAAYRRCLHGESVACEEGHMIVRGGGSEWIRWHMEPWRASDGEIGGLIQFVEIITARKLAEEQLRLASIVFENANEAIFITDEKNHIISINHAFTKITGYNLYEVRGKDPHMMSSGRHSNDFYETMWSEIKELGQWQGEIWNRRKSGEIFPQWMSVTVLRNPTGAVQRHIAIFSDITQRKKDEDTILHQATYDALTDLPNRLLFMDRLDQALATKARDCNQGALLFIDLDDFKRVNDRCGHAAGDTLLQEIAKRLCSCVRGSDSVARLGGDEFTIILPKIQGSFDAETVALKVLARLAQPISLGSSEVCISASIGITLFPQDGELRDKVMRNADTAMFQAKESGRNTLRFFTQEMNVRYAERIALEGRLKCALADDELTLHYQPMAVLGSGDITHVAALLRWAPPDQEIMVPADFLCIAEETGLIVPMGDWMLHTVCKQIHPLRTQTNIPGLNITLNISARQFMDPRSVDRLAKILEDAAIDPSDLTLEIAEPLMEDKPERGLIDRMKALKALGVGLALDNFGSGNSRLDCLNTLPVDMLKIDSNYVLALENDPHTRAIITAILTIAHSLGIKVVAKGVETMTQADILRDLQCDMFQGHVLCPPLPMDELDEFFSRR